MKVFVLLSRFPYPLEKGDKLRAFHQIKELSKHHEIILCAISDEPVSKESYRILSQYCSKIEVIRIYKWKIYLNLIFKLFFTKQSLQVSYFYTKKAQKKIDKLIEVEKPNHIYCQLIRVSEYIKNSAAPKTMDYMDALAKGMERRAENVPFYLKPFFKIETTRLKRYENHIFNYFNHLTIISQQDRDFIVHIKNDRIVVVPNGVDYTTYKHRVIDKKYDLIFTGNMSYPPNVDTAVFLVKEVMPLVWKTNPSIQLAIVGATPHFRVSTLRSDKVTITGWVDDISYYYASSKVFIAPMQTGTTGLQNKLLEAMAMKLPCITSKLANNALGAEHQKNILIGENRHEFAQHVISLLKNEELRLSIAEEGYSFVTKNYTWEGSTAILNNLIRST